MILRIGSKKKAETDNAPPVVVGKKQGCGNPAYGVRCVEHEA